MSPEDTQPQSPSSVESETVKNADSFETAPHGWQYRFVDGASARVLRVMERPEFRKALDESLRRDELADGANRSPSACQDSAAPASD